MTKPTFLDRMAHVRDVAWGHSTAGYWVEWEEDGTRKITHFRFSSNAEKFARWLDTAGGEHLTKREVLAAHRALRDLEEALRESKRERILARAVRVRGHRRRA